MRFITMFLSLFIAIGLMAASPPPGTPMLDNIALSTPLTGIDAQHAGLTETDVGVIADKEKLEVDVGVIAPAELNEKQIAIVTADQVMKVAADTAIVTTSKLIFGPGTSAEHRSPVGIRTMIAGDQTNASVVLLGLRV